MQNQAKLRSCRTSPRHKFGYKLPSNNDHDHAIESNRRNGDDLWRDAIKLETHQQNDFNACKDLGLNEKSPEECKKIIFYFVFDVKHDGRYKARLVADGNLT